MQYALAPWSWNTDDQEANPNHFWDIQDSVGLIDLRTVPEMGTPGPVAQGFGFAAFPNLTPLPPGSIPLGDGLSRSLTQRQKNNVKAAFSLGENIVAADLLGVIRELLVQHADPTGQARLKPLLPTVNGRMEMHLGGHSQVLSEIYDPTAHPLVLELVQEDYRQVREETLGRMARGISNRDPQFHRRYLQALVEKYGRWFNWEELIPSDLPRETPLPHGTTLQDTFVETSDTSLDAHTATGPNSGFSWAEVEGDYLVVAATDRAEDQSTSDNSARAESDLASADHFSENDISRSSGGGSRRAGAATRFAAAATTYYRFVIALEDDEYQIAKVVTGTKTELFSAVHDGDPDPDDINTVQGKSNGSTQELFFDAVSKLSGTDTAITGNVRAGIYSRNNATYRHDNFKAEDVAAAGISIPVAMHAYRRLHQGVF